MIFVDFRYFTKVSELEMKTSATLSSEMRLTFIYERPAKTVS